MPNAKNTQGLTLMAELQNYRQHGISFWLGESPSSPDRICEAVQVREGAPFMRDYVFQDGELREIRFDRIDES